MLSADMVGELLFREKSQESPWQIKYHDTFNEKPCNFAMDIIGGRKSCWDYDLLYVDEHSWVRDIFKSETTHWTEERDRHHKFTPRRNKLIRNQELHTGDTSELDSFLANFKK